VFPKKKKKNFEEKIPDPSTREAIETSKKWMRKKRLI